MFRTRVFSLIAILVWHAQLAAFIAAQPPVQVEPVAEFKLIESWPPNFPNDRVAMVPSPSTPDSNQSSDSDRNEVTTLLMELDALASDQSDATFPTTETNWWESDVQTAIEPERRPYQAGMEQLIQLALANSAQIRVYEITPEIRQTAVTQAASAFDWTHFLDTTWKDSSDPVGSSLTVGPGASRFNDHNWEGRGGYRRKSDRGASSEIVQRFGHQNSNSQFFLPNNQGTSRLVLRYIQPLLRGRGKAYNRSLIVLAQIDVGRARDEYQRQLQQHLLEVARGYWSLYLERANLVQRVSLYVKTQEVLSRLIERQRLDAGRLQVVQAEAALSSRRSDLIRARAAVQNSETRLRALINAEQLDPNTEIVPTESPTVGGFQPDLEFEFAQAIQNRPEIAAAVKEIRASSVRLRMAKHEILPVLDLVTDAYVAGLRGESRIDEAFVDQFRNGAPSYSLGLEWQMPVGRRAAYANERRRRLESIQLTEKYRSTLELVNAEVDVAVREVKTSYRELSAKSQAREAAAADTETTRVRWESLGGRDNNASLMLESLLRAQERLTQAEFELAKAEVTYSLSLINLRQANGTLLQIYSDNVR